MEDPGNEVGNICDGNNVSGTMCPRSQGPYDFDFVFKAEYCKTDWLRVTLCDYLEKKPEIQ